MKPLSEGYLSSWVEKRLAELAPRFQQPPPVDSRRLMVAGRPAGWVTDTARKVIEYCPGVYFDMATTHIVATDHYAAHSLQHVLDTVARTLHTAGCLPGWRDEPVDVIANGQLVATLERAAMRPLGLFTRAVHLNAWSASGGLWVARRADTKATNPGRWDTTVGGLVSAGEGVDLTLVRESAEEAGLSAQNLARRTSLRIAAKLACRIPEGYQVEELLVADCILPKDVSPANEDGEVSAFECMSMPDLLEHLAAGVFTLEAELAILDSLTRMQVPSMGK